MSKLDEKWPSYAQFNVLVPKLHLAYFVPIDGHFGQFVRYGLQICFWSILEDRIANFGLIDFKLGLYIKVNVNEGKNKFEVHI